MSKLKGERLKVKGLFILLCALYVILLPSCNPEAPWTTDKVDITVRIEAASAGFVVCEFTTSKEAYYLIGIEPARPGYDPMTQQKQFMTLALDAANSAYLDWRSLLLKNGEFNIAPFASHSLQYGNEYYIFTGLKPDTEYWIYAFVVNPVSMKPAGHLVLEDITTGPYSDIQMQYEYRVKGLWDYTYPMDDYGIIETRFPYLAITCDSLELAGNGQTPEVYFAQWFNDQLAHPEDAKILYGVKAVENDGANSYLEFEEGHTYYTTIASFDGPFSHMVTYKFTWTGNNYQRYFKEDEDALIVDNYDFNSGE